jgi:hypothetical protein
MKEDEARQRDARVSMSLSVDHSTIGRRSARPLHWQSGDSALPAKAHLDKQYKLWNGSRAESCWLHDISVAVQNKARLDSATDAAWFISQAWRLREVRSCSARSVACSFPPPLPTGYLFLEGGQPLNHKISVRHPHKNDVLFTLFAWDHKDGALHYGLLHTACAIIADNRHDGYLSCIQKSQWRTHRSGPRRPRPLPADRLLLPRTR